MDMDFVTAYFLVVFSFHLQFHAVTTVAADDDATLDILKCWIPCNFGFTGFEGEALHEVARASLPERIHAFLLRDWDLTHTLLFLVYTAVLPMTGCSYYHECW